MHSARALADLNFNKSSGIIAGIGHFAIIDGQTVYHEEAEDMLKENANGTSNNQMERMESNLISDRTNSNQTNTHQ